MTAGHKCIGFNAHVLADLARTGGLAVCRTVSEKPIALVGRDGDRIGGNHHMGRHRGERHGLRFIGGPSAKWAAPDCEFNGLTLGATGHRVLRRMATVPCDVS